MPRIQPVQISQTEGQSRQQLEDVQRGLGMVPNLVKTIAHSPAVLAAYLDFSGALSKALSPPVREQIALAVAGVNQCNYCASAHGVLGEKVGVKAEEIASSLRGDSSDEKIRAALHFSVALVEKRGWVSDEDLARVRAAGYGDKQIVEIIALVALNLFTNYFNHVAKTEIDFPVVDTGSRLSRA